MSASSPHGADAGPPAGSSDASSPESTSGRRTMLRLAIGVLGAGVAAVGVIPGLGSVLDPLLRRRSREAPFVPLGPEEVVSSEHAVELPVIGELRDAWTRATAQRLGSVWIRRKPDGQLQALSGECPHLGCRVGYDKSTDEYLCPCHDAKFDASGRRLSGPSKRGMDALESRIREGLVEVRFKRFRTNRAEQVELG